MNYLEGLFCDLFGESAVQFVTAGVLALDGHGRDHEGQEEAKDEDGKAETGHCDYDVWVCGKEKRSRIEVRSINKECG